jgi:hypothetical protein
MNKIIEINKKNGTIIVRAENELEAEKLALKTDIFNSNLEVEIDDIRKEKSGNFTIQYTEYGEADMDYYL